MSDVELAAARDEATHHRLLSRTGWTRALLALVVLPLAACASTAQATAPASSPTPSTPSTFSITGTITVPGKSTGPNDPTGCTTERGYNDVAAGTQVVVTNAQGATIALGQVGLRQRETETSAYGLPTDDYVGRSTRCVFPISVGSVPLGIDFYGVEVSHRGVLQYPAAEVRRPVTLTLG